MPLRSWTAGDRDAVAESHLQLVLKHFAGRIARELVDERPPPRYLVGGQRNQAVLSQHLCIQVLTGSGHDDRAQVLAADIVRDADDRNFLHAGMREDGVLHVDGIDVGPAPDDHVLGPSADVEVAVLVQPADVACVQPTVDPGRFRGLRVIEVLALTTGYPQLYLPVRTGGHNDAVVVDTPDLSRGKRLSDGAWASDRK